MFAAKFNKTHLRSIFGQFIADGAAVGRDGVALNKFKPRLDSYIDIILRKTRLRTY